ncbi:ATP-grasp fold amidoligase family protein [Euzebyella saccharophila]|uniref:ATP-grasp fold amidoligase family protein n=1 Tax=Euzebyella saccharophila TaxID=679664 RepID=A0ABV8JVU2_9FLAO|nr:ATP-grasp fold amidoligase family protein [Euzebyella saccharophila]
MFKFFRNLYYNTRLGKILIFPLLKLRNVIIPETILIKTRFKRSLGYSLNLTKPTTYNEKLQWLKVNDRSDLHIKCADKYMVRSYIESNIGKKYLIPLVYQTLDANEITSSILPEYPFIVKTNHDSGGVWVIRDKSKIDLADLKKEWKKNLKKNYDSGKGEWQYKQIQPRLVIEKLLLDKNNEIPSDFKFHCLNGKVAFIQVDLNRATNHKRNLYDPKWNLLPFTIRYSNGINIERPKSLDKMIAIAEKLAKDFICVRVDLYLVMGKIYFGELTFHPGAGFDKFTPMEWDYKFGKMLQLPIEK